LTGQTITVRTPMAWKRHGGRKVIIAPDGRDAWAPAEPRPDETILRVAFCWVDAVEKLFLMPQGKGLIHEHNIGVIKYAQDGSTDYIVQT
jgi:hypothetical protein